MQAFDSDVAFYKNESTLISAVKPVVFLSLTSVAFVQMVSWFNTKIISMALNCLEQNIVSFIKCTKEMHTHQPIYMHDILLIYRQTFS